MRVSDYYGEEIKAVSETNRGQTVTMKDLTPYTAFMHYAYEYSPAGNVNTKNTEHGDYAYQYDSLYRLTDADNPSSSDETYTYDALGNRLSSAGVIGTWNYNDNNELLAYDDVAYDYDDEGNIIQKAVGQVTTNYIYDIENRLVQVEDSPEDVIAEYYYDPFGKRLWKEVGGSRTYYFYSDEGLIGEYDSGGNEIKTYGYKPDSTWSTNTIFQKIGGSYYWYINDHLGTPQLIIDTTGKTVWAATYDSFGKTTITTEEITNNLRFPGQYYDTETGLHYNWNRYYDSSIGRYVSKDPIGFEGGINLYAFVQNNPLNLFDPYGLVPILFGLSNTEQPPGPSNPCIIGCHPPSPPPPVNPPRVPPGKLCEIVCEIFCEIGEHCIGVPLHVSVPTCLTFCAGLCHGFFL